MSWHWLTEFLGDAVLRDYSGRKSRPDTQDPPVSPTIELGANANGRVLDARVLDLVVITLPVHPRSDVRAQLVPPDPMKLLVLEDGTVGPLYRVGCRPLARGEQRIQVQYLLDDGTVESTWDVCLSVKK